MQDQLLPTKIYQMLSQTSLEILGKGHLTGYSKNKKKPNFKNPHTAGMKNQIKQKENSDLSLFAPSVMYF